MWGATGYLHAITDCRENFNPRSPCGERPQLLDISRCTATISIHAPRVGSDAADGRMSPGSVISIHAPRVGSDQDYRIFAAEYIISIHAPRVGSDIIQTAPVKGLSEEFQSTLPVWGATLLVFELLMRRLFQSTLPVWGATLCPSQTMRSERSISIHAPRVGSDNRQNTQNRGLSYFNPRSPCGERQKTRWNCPTLPIFQSTLPVWGATAKMHRFFFCIFGKKGIFCDILQIGRRLQGIGRKRRGDFLSRSVRTSRGKYGCLAFAFRESGGLRENRRFYSQSVLFSFRIDCQGSRIAGCPFRGP